MQLRDLDPVLVPCGKFFFKYRDFLFPVVLVCLAVLLQPVALLGQPALDPILDGVGILVATSGQALRCITIGFAYVKRGGKNKKVYADSLVQNGLFAHSRNPMYLGNLLVLIGFAIIHNSPWFYALGLGFFFFAYYAIIANEEQFLRKEFGAAFDAYCARVNRFLPSLRGITQTLGGMQFQGLRVIRKEYGTLFTFITCILGMLALDRVRLDGYHAAEEYLLVLLGVWLIALCGWAAARIMKKMRLLGTA